MGIATSLVMANQSLRCDVTLRRAHTAASKGRSKNLNVYRAHGTVVNSPCTRLTRTRNTGRVKVCDRGTSLTTMSSNMPMTPWLRLLLEFPTLCASAHEVMTRMGPAPTMTTVRTPAPCISFTKSAGLRARARRPRMSVTEKVFVIPVFGR